MKSESAQAALRSAVGMNLASAAKSRPLDALSPAFLALLVPTQEKLATRTPPPGFPLTSANIGSPAGCYRVTTTKVQMLRPLTAPFSLLPSSFSIHRCASNPELPSPNPELSSPNVELPSPKPELSSPNAPPPRWDELPRRPVAPTCRAEAYARRRKPPGEGGKPSPPRPMTAVSRIWSAPRPRGQQRDIAYDYENHVPRTDQ